jgi:acetyl esterase/lipase
MTTHRQTLAAMMLSVLLMLSPVRSNAQSDVEENVVYGMYSGLALLMDVYLPQQPNGLGVIFIMGSGWHSDQSYDAAPLKDAARLPVLPAQALVQAGYTVFSINHRAAPRFRYPAAVEDARRAVEFVRSNAARYNIDPDSIGAVGMSSGAHLALMLGVLDEDAGPRHQSGADVSTKVQAVVAMAAPTDFTAFVADPNGRRDVVASFLGAPLNLGSGPDSPEAITYREASPITYISSDDAPVFLVHGDSDTTVPYGQSVILRDELMRQGVDVELMTIEGADHDMGATREEGPPDFLTPTVEWFDRYLRD